MSRGRIPTYLRRQMNDLMGLFLGNRISTNQLELLQTRTSNSSMHVTFFRRYNRRRHRQMLSDLMNMFYFHQTSYDMVLRPTTLFREPPVVNPLQECSSHRFYQLCGFWPDQFTEVIDNLLLIPDIIVCDRSRCSTSKTLALFIMLRSWQKADTWDDVAHEVPHGHVWCIKNYQKDLPAFHPLQTSSPGAGL